ncbi:MAG TPA: hypothetical protein PLS90_01050 [Candidatus Sumerlaeota bacterium]|nr:MAG: hypothetical protein BWZ08_00453 [candidate division BRC1 bacterium ADurb.BinA292]HOE97618.1 hypothetical protein [Candidatus Sumerlaeota bacterium]HPK01018.1 hypothetical protein [Candidatus Sumerlaeota bacterium]
MNATIFMLLPFLVVGMFVFVIGAIILVLVNRRKAMQRAWTGQITRKYTSKDRRSAKHGRDLPHYYIYYRSDGGEEGRLAVGEAIFHSLQVGDRVVKEPGKYPAKAPAA